jgi:PTH1 family peptidyl-tRNA hydrolase
MMPGYYSVTVKLIVGLGNPGRLYAGNRHNIGFYCLNDFARRHGIRLNRKQSKARTGSGEVDGIRVVLAKPQTFMNLSGQAASLLMKKFKISYDDLIVVHDDLDLTPGRVRIRRGGGSGGHKGVASIIDELGSQEFVRLRVGIGRPLCADGTGVFNEEEIVDFVLSDFAPDEKEIIEQAGAEASEALRCLLIEGLEAAMNRCN